MAERMQHGRLPRGSCDCHVHLFGRAEHFPFAPTRTYTPGEANEASLLSLHATLGIERVVLVQPSVYGSDNRRMLAGLSALSGHARGVAVIDESTTERDLEALHDAGVRGIRLNLQATAMEDPERACALLQRKAERVAALGWNVQLLASAPVIHKLGDRLAALKTPVVVDHFGLPDIAQGPDQPGFATLRRLVTTGRVHAKLGAFERLTGQGRLKFIMPFIAALVDAAPQALIWGSDWPHPGGGRGLPDDGQMIEPFMETDDVAALDCLLETVPDAQTRALILATNPAVLYGFPEGR